MAVFPFEAIVYSRSGIILSPV